MWIYSSITIFAIIINKVHHKCSAGLYVGLQKYWVFQSEAKVEQIIAIVTTRSVSCLKFDILLQQRNTVRKDETRSKCYAFSPVSDVDVEEFCLLLLLLLFFGVFCFVLFLFFFNTELKIPYRKSQFHEHIFFETMN